MVLLQPNSQETLQKASFWKDQNYQSFHILFYIELENMSIINENEIFFIVK
jgi:hypothetical protein